MILLVVALMVPPTVLPLMVGGTILHHRMDFVLSLHTVYIALADSKMINNWPVGGLLLLLCIVSTKNLHFSD